MLRHLPPGNLKVTPIIGVDATDNFKWADKRVVVALAFVEFGIASGFAEDHRALKNITGNQIGLD